MHVAICAVPLSLSGHRANGGLGHRTDAVAALRAAQSADKLYKAGDREQGLIAAASYRTGCEIFARIVDGANSLLRCSNARRAAVTHPQLPPHVSDVDTDENARAAIRPKIAQIRSRLKKLEAAIPEAAASAMRQAGVQKETDAATLIQARVRGANPLACPPPHVGVPFQVNA